MLSNSRFYEFVREERLFCAILAHLLLQKGPNLATFLKLVDSKLGGRLPLAKAKLEDVEIKDAEVYVEFTYLRDDWNELGKDNDAKRQRIMELFAKVDGLKGFADDDFPREISSFNELFVGPRGKKFHRKISYPGHWSVAALFKKFGQEPKQFSDFCRFKWAFNIKPDIVVLVPGLKPLCIEAKLESGEGQYPAEGAECRMFDRAFGPKKGRVKQIELQRFMFKTLLDDPCETLFIARNTGDGARLSWQEVFAPLDLSASIDFVRKLVEENKHLKSDH